jgi:GT2 family glycosyltransferase
MLVQCLEALARQTHPVAEVVLVDNASSDGTLERIEGTDLPGRLSVRYVRVRRNAGGAEGFHYGVRAALELESDWLWLMDDDCEPGSDTLSRLLAAEHARDAAVVAPVVVDAQGRVLPINHGHIRRRYFFAPLVAASREEDDAGEHRIEFCSFVGPLLRTSVVREIGLPKRDLFIRNDDVEYLSRLPADQAMWLVGGVRIVHKDPQPVAGADLLTKWRDFARQMPFAQSWKLLYGFRNLLYCGYRYGWIDRLQALSYVLVQTVRVLLFYERRALTLRLLWMYARDARRGVFRNLPPDRWVELDGRRAGQMLEREGLRYDEDVADAPIPHRGAPSPPTRPVR